MDTRILITGGLGQLGSELSDTLRQRYGDSNVMVTDIRQPSEPPDRFQILDARDGERLSEIVQTERITRIYHLAALLSAVAEDRPQAAWDINMRGLTAVLEVARESGCSVFTPSSIPGRI